MLRLYFSTPLLFAHLLFKPSAKSYWLCLSSSRRLLLNIVSPTVIKPLVQAIFRPEMNYHNSFLSDLVPLSLQSFSSWSQSASQWVYVPCLLKSLQRHFISVKTKVVKNITNILGSDSSFPFFPPHLKLLPARLHLQLPCCSRYSQTNQEFVPPKSSPLLFLRFGMVSRYYITQSLIYLRFFIKISSSN